MEMYSTESGMTYNMFNMKAPASAIQMDVLARTDAWAFAGQADIRIKAL